MAALTGICYDHPNVSGRYEILDILAQDASEVVYEARDRETDQRVVLRRFFPFGADGGGLESEERTAYDVAIRRLKRATHPALRRVLDGGTDPIDGIPFLITEWMEGRQLSQSLADHPLNAAAARALADLALQTSIALSQVFGEEAIWIETNTRSIYLNDSNPQHPVSFRISPFRWLGGGHRKHSLTPLLEMVEEITGWHGRLISGNAGGGLGAWIKELRKRADSWSLAEAHEALRSCPIQNHPPETGNSILPAPVNTLTPAAPPSRPRSHPSWVIAGLAVAILLGGTATWIALRAPSDAAPLANADTPLVLGQSIDLQTRVTQVRTSPSGKTIYLDFDPATTPPVPIARYHTRHETILPLDLKKFSGRPIRIRGRVVSDPSGQPAIDLTALAQIQPLKD